MRKDSAFKKEWLATTRGITLRVSHETHAEVLKYAEANKISVAEAVRTFIEWGLEGEK